jgi:L-rhamnose-H+ transport protein
MAVDACGKKKEQGLITNLARPEESGALSMSLSTKTHARMAERCPFVLLFLSLLFVLTAGIAVPAQRSSNSPAALVGNATAAPAGGSGDANTGVGLVLIVLGGISSGLFTTPMRWIHGWEWENIWLVYSVFGMVLVPWLLTVIAIPDLAVFYNAASAIMFVKVSLFGAGWGLGSVLFGLGTAIVGNSLGFSLILGLTATLGSAIVLVAQHEDEVSSKAGIYNFIGLGITCCGLAFIGFAGFHKEREQSQARLVGMHAPLLETGTGEALSLNTSAAPKRASFAVGFGICLLSGVFSPMLNFSLSFGDGITKLAAHRARVVLSNSTGADPIVTCELDDASLLAGNSVWVIGVGSGFVVNAAYTTYLLLKHSSWRKYSPTAQEMARYYSELAQHPAEPFYHAHFGGLMNWVYAGLMGLLWFAGNSLYSTGASQMGSLGTAVGWPVFITSMILTGNVSGVVNNEWAGVTNRTKGTMALGNLLLVAAVVVAAVGTV